MSLVQKRFFGLIGFLFLGLIGGYIFSWQGEKSAEKKEAEILDGRVFTTLDLANLHSLHFKNPKGEVTVTRQKNGEEFSWVITDPIKAEADSVALLGMLAHLTRAKALIYVGKPSVGEDGEDTIIPPTDLSIYGLDKPRYELTATPQEGDPETLLGGEINSFDKSLFVKMKASKHVMSVPGQFEYQINKTLFDLRQKKVFSFEHPKVVKLAVEYGGKLQYVVEKHPETGLFYCVEPTSFRADSDQVAMALTALGNLQAKEFISDSADGEMLRKYGFDQPKFRATVSSEGGSSTTILYSAIGPKESKKEYAMIEGSGVIARISVFGTLKRVALDLKTLRDKKAIGFNRKLVSSIELHAEKEVVQLRRQENKDEFNWKMLKPTPRNVRDSQVEGVLYKLESLRWVSFTEAHTKEDPLDDKVLEARGISEKAPRVKLFTEDGILLSSSRFGKVVNRQRFVMDEASGQIMLVNAQTLEDLKWRASEFDDALDDAN